MTKPKGKSDKYLYILSFLMILTSCNNQVSSFATSDSSNTDIISSSESSQSSETESSASEQNSEPNTSTTEEERVMMRQSYTNSVYYNDFPDPAGVYDLEQEAWFLYATGGQIIRSYDGVNWTKLANAFPAIPNWGTPGAGIWAPEVQFIGGQYVMYYSLSTWGDPNPGIGVATAPRPQGPWTDRGELFRSIEIGVNNSIDAGVFIAEDGRVYMIWGSMRGNYIVELTRDGLSLRAGSVANANSTKLHIAGLDTSIGWTVDTYEAAYVRYWNGYYYLFLSMGTCCEGANSTYEVVVSRSTSPTGPYVDHLGRDMRARNVGKKVISKNSTFVGTGHNSVIDDVNGEPWFYYHAFDLANTGRGRVLLMERMLFDEDGWPYVSGLTPSTTSKIGPHYYLNKGEE